MNNLFEMMNRSFDSMYTVQSNSKLNENFNSLKESEESLDEALPKDLMKSIKNASGKDYRGFNGGTEIRTDWQGNEYSNVKDYANATYSELSPEQVLAMKKDGADLSNIYIMKNGRMMRLEKSGHPDEYNSEMSDLRSNQSLKKSLEGADKIYMADIPDFLNSQPDKARARLSDEDSRENNLKLGHNRPRWDDDSRRKSDYVRAKQRYSGTSKEIQDIKQQYEDGDISRKEMESRIEKLRKNSTPSQYEINDYNSIRRRQSDARNFESERNLQKPFDELKNARSVIKSANYDLKRDIEKLQSIQNDDTSEYSDYLYAQRQVEKIQQQIASLQRDLERYQTQIDNGAKEKDIQAYGDKIKKSEQSIIDAQNKIDTLLRRK